MAASVAKIGKAAMAGRFKKSYFDVLGLCCSSEVPLIEKILSPIDGVKEVTVIVPSRTVIVVHDELLVSQSDIVKLLNQARLEASVRVLGQTTYQKKWPSPYAVVCGGLLLLSFLKYVYRPFQWLAVAAVAVGILPIALKAVAAIRSLRFNISILVLITVAGTIFLRDYIEAGTIVFLFIIADWLEARASHKATAVMSSLMSMAPQKAVLAESGEMVAVEDVKVGSVIAVKAGELIPVDGIVVEGKCEVDERTLTGESFPKAKQVDSIVWAGTINLNGYICVKTTVLAEDCVVARMAKLVEEAQNTKSTTQRLVDKCTQYYTPAIILVSAGIACIPFLPHMGDRKKWILLALVVLVSACPCALVLSTPVATFCALSKAATNGLLIKGGNHLETLAKTKTMAFDKTGTLTTGDFVVKNIQPLHDDISLDLLLFWVSSLESKSSHPMAAAFVDYAKSHSIMPRAEMVEEYEIIPGEGIHGRINGVDVFVGNEKMAVRAACAYPLPLVSSAEGETIGWIYSHSATIGTYSLSDTCRSGVAEAVVELKLMGIRTAMLTGDSNSAAMEVQKQAGNAIDDIHSGLLPEQKASIIKDYQKHGRTAMVGDGLNDTIALATADVGISMGISGSALASETGNMILMTNDVRKLPKAMKLARRARRKIVENIVISITTKTAILALAFAGYPLVWAAVLADTGTCLVVILNSMLLLRGVDGRSHSHHCAKHECRKTSARQVEGHCTHKMHVECNTASHQSQPCRRAAQHADCSATLQKSPACGSSEHRCSHANEPHNKAEHTLHTSPGHCCSHGEERHSEAEHRTHTGPEHCCSNAEEPHSKAEHAACSSTCSDARNVVPERLSACGTACSSAGDYGRCCGVSRRKCGKSCRVEFCEKHACRGAPFGVVLSEIAIE